VRRSPSRFSVLTALLLASSIAAAEAGETPPPESADPRPAEKPRYGVAAAEILGSNAAVYLFDRLVLRADYAQNDFSTIRTNLSSPWVFDHDKFSTNEIAHPYHGSIYFTAGRANGLGFWGAAAGTALGSATWELFGETELPSINDIVSTTTGGTVLGEMFHRLYHTARLGGSPLRFVASPMDALTEALFDGDPEYADASTDIAVSLRAGMSLPDIEMSEKRGIESGRAEALGLVAESISYGDPFEPGPTKPFSHFEQRMHLGFSPSAYSVSFFANGSLCSFLLVDEPYAKLSAGASLHYDFIFSSMVDISANSAGLSLNAARRFDGDFTITGQIHLNGVVMGSNDNVFLRKRAEAAGVDADFRNYDFGLGEGAKVYLLVSQPKLGSLSIEYVAYGLHAIPSAQEENSSFDYAFMGILELAYEHKTSKHLALGLSYMLYDKHAFYDPDIRIDESVQSVTIYMKIL
jgi:hypothetical protein